jgi:CheY-like chemotaxis protein
MCSAKDRKVLQDWDDVITTFRQFARAVSADQMLGDVVAAAVLKRLELPGQAPETPEARVSAFFQQAMPIWRTLAADSAPRFGHSALIASGNHLFAPDRQAGVLTDVIGIPPTTAASMIGIAPATYEGHLTQSRRMQKAPIAAPVLVIEDDPLIAARHEQVARIRGATRIEVARSYEQAVYAAQQMEPAIVVADFDLGGGKTGLDAARVISDAYGSSILFVTAYPKDVLRGIEGEPAFVLEKPCRDATIGSALFFASTRERPAFLAA